jgi:hypothetical protein
MTPDDIAMKINEATAVVTQKAILAGTAAINNHNSADAFHIGCMAILGALQPTAMISAKRPQMSREEAIEKGHEVCMTLLIPETLVFTALVAVYQQQEANKNGNITCEFGPHILLQALESCEKVFGKPIDDKLDPVMVQAARDCGKGSNLPFEELMAKRTAAHQPSKTLQ